MIYYTAEHGRFSFRSLVYDFYSFGDSMSETNTINTTKCSMVFREPIKYRKNVIFLGNFDN